MTTRFPSCRFPLPCRIFRLLLLTVLIGATGCDQENEPLTMADLSPEENVFIERMIILERAKTVALLDRDLGDALLDSVAIAWGDSSLQQTLKGAPRDPLRSEAVTALLRRVMEAEQESLLISTGQDRLHKPLPEPAPVVPDSLPGF